MLKVLKILVTAHALVGGAAMLSACGQKGALFLPSTPESLGRATLPQTLKMWPAPTESVPPAQPAPGASPGPSASSPTLSSPTPRPSNLPAAPKTTPP
ncbi:lipoprotein [Limnohabitans sp. G3-2]|uniref:LPS translocon maturation chaperone LptM n=1 Tax=Limnohabitans sp. G3-2 TaxID=1100711 RepID=UPI000C1E1E83|nr:lipoprotein [Limnohabitans sp. G3-2]PIT74098.1 hypothetical protein B9Z31_09650 [Limnohabitans sp. G3-2]